MSNGVRLEGFDEFRNKLKSAPKQVQVKATGIVKDLAAKWQSLATKSAPVDQKALRDGITYNVDSKGDIVIGEVYSNAEYSPFVEWGTKGKRFVPSDLVGYAGSLQYKKTGNYEQFVRAIYDWVKRKGIGATYKISTRRKNKQSVDEIKKLAEAITWSISKKGINPHPFFFIHKANIEQELKARLKEAFE